MGGAGHLHLRPRLAPRRARAGLLCAAVWLWASAAAARPIFFYPPPVRLSDGSVLSSPVTFTADQIGPAFPYVREMAGVAMIVTWSQLCPTRDRCDFAMIDQTLRYWRARGRQVVLGIATVGFPYRIAGGGVASATPDWVLDEVDTYASSTLVIGEAGGAASATSRFPSYADPRFRDEVKALIARLARYDGDPAVAQLRISAGLLTEDDPSPAGLAYVIPGYGDADWLNWCRAMAAAFEDAFHRTPLEFDVARLAMAYEADGDMRGPIDEFFDGLIRRHVMIAYNGLRGATRAASSSPAPGASRDGSRYALELLRRARAHGDATGLELYAPSTDPAMQDRAAMIEVVRRLRPSRIVAFSTEAAMVHHRRGGAASSDADSMRWIAAQPAAEATQAASVDFLEDLVRD